MPNGNTFNFYNSKKKSNEKSDVKEKPEVIKSKILAAYDKYQNMLTNDLKLKEMVSEEQFLSGQFVKSYNELKQIAEGKDVKKERIEELDQKMSNLDSQHQSALKRKNEYLENEFEWLKTKYPDIFKLITGNQPPARETFESVLETFLETESGRATKQSAVKASLEKLRKSHGLPADFFDYGKLDQYC